MKNETQEKTMTRKIGNMTYEVHIRFSENSKETMDDKIRRMLEAKIKSGE